MEGSVSLRNILRKHFPSFNQFELVEAIAANSTLVKVPAGELLLDVGQVVRLIPLVIEGSLKVFREDEQGREVFLYYIRPGESCAMTLASAISPGISQIKAVVLEDAAIVALSTSALHDVNKKFPSWFSFVSGTFRKKFEELLQAFEGVVFSHLDMRVLNYLKQLSEVKATNVLTISHSAIARDLATSREVISRILKQMEKKGHLLLARGQIELL